MTAQRLLIERNNKDVVPKLIALVNDQSLDEIGNNPAAIHALWILNGLNVLDGSDQSASMAVNQALKHPAPAVRKTAVQVMPTNSDVAGTLLKANMLNDKEPLVVLNTILALSKLPPNPSRRCCSTGSSDN